KNWSPMWRLFWRHQLAICCAVRIGLIAYSYAHDALFEVKYTDIDYLVFNNASRHMLQGRSPYLESEYRYTPLIALVTLGNFLLHSGFGKFVFAAADVACGCLLAGLTSWPAAAAWLWNPIVLGVSSRGSAEPLILLCVLACLRCLLAGRFAACGLALGLSVHAKLYPVIYCPAICLHVWRTSASASQAVSRLIRLAICAALSFGAPLALFYHLYGNEFMSQAYLYHFGRLDPQHNFSVYFLPMRLLGPRILRAVSGLAFGLQAGSVLLFSWAVPHQDACWFFVTFGFVSLNKVITSQYFLWYLVFLPLLLYRLVPSSGRWLLCQLAIAWLLPQTVWLGLAYLLEFRRLPIVELVWLASLFVLLSNAWIAWRLFDAYRRRMQGDSEAKKRD
ncbi:hypothetical protein BOX15_Mlig013222g5, partial [Macrostomum lignano]